MPKFNPVYTLSPAIVQALMHVQGVKQLLINLPLTPSVLKALRETARLKTIHYSTQIEGNRLTQVQVQQVIEEGTHIPGRDRDEKEVRGYYAALEYVEQYARTGQGITQQTIQMLHALVIGEGKQRVKPTPYRDGQNVIRDGATGAIVYLPPEAKDVGDLMQTLIEWINVQTHVLPIPIIGAITHYQFATIHPYYDGNGRTARLLATLILHRGGYDLKGIYSLEEYYARDLGSYYQAIAVGPSHNYYMGRVESDITDWITYFCDGMAQAFERVQNQAQQAISRGKKDVSDSLRALDPKQRKALTLFAQYKVVTASQIAELFGFQPRTARALCQKWVEDQFLIAVDQSRKGRKYQLAPEYEDLVVG
jgi:Fic family protein